MEDNKIPKWRIATIIMVVLISALIYRIGWWTFVDSYELGYQYDKTTGKITVLSRTGWHRVTPLITEIHTIDMRPMQIRIEANININNGGNGVNTRVLNAMLVRFRAEGLDQFLSYHGRMNYDQQTLSEILKIYAYEGCATDHYSKEKLEKKYKFLDIMTTTAADSSGTIDTLNQ